MNNYSSHRCVRQNARIVGDSIIAQHYDVTSTQQCQNLCRSNGGCLYFNYYGRIKSCDLYSGMLRIDYGYESNGYVSGPDVCL